MHFRAVMNDSSRYAEIAKKLSASANTSDGTLQKQLTQSIVQLLDTFAKGGLAT